MPEPMTSASLEETAQLADEALRLVQEGRYEELLSHTAAVERQIEPLERLRSSLVEAGSVPDGTAETCRRLRSRLAVLAEVLRHTATVHYALREMEAVFTSGYSAGGQPQPAAETRWSAEV